MSFKIFLHEKWFGIAKGFIQAWIQTTATYAQAAVRFSIFET